MMPSTYDADKDSQPPREQGYDNKNRLGHRKTIFEKLSLLGKKERLHSASKESTLMDFTHSFIHSFN
jgi:hypothetical protein